MRTFNFDDLYCVFIIETLDSLLVWNRSEISFQIVSPKHMSPLPTTPYEKYLITWWFKHMLIRLLITKILEQFRRKNAGNYLLLEKCKFYIRNYVRFWSTQCIFWLLISPYNPEWFRLQKVNYIIDQIQINIIV